MSRGDARAAARAKAAAEREAERRRRRRNRALGIGGAVVGVLVVAGAVTGIVLANSGSTASADTAASGAGRTSAPPWAAPSDVEARVKAAGLSMLTAEGEALHIHQHLSVTIDGKAVTVPADIGIDEAAQELSAIHTHDASGVIHVESPVVKTFTLGEVFAEWDVALGKGRVGGYRNGHDGDRVTLFVDQKPYTGDPRTLKLASRQDLDFVVTTDGAAPTAPKPYTFAAGL